MKFMTWSLKRPTSGDFDKYYKIRSGQPWYSKDFVLQDPNAPMLWSAGARSFVETIEKHPNKIYALGMHEFGTSDNGDIFNMGFGNILYPNGYEYNNPNMRVLNSAETDIDLPVPTSLRYLMHTYPQIRWSLQFLATSNSSGDRVTSILKNESKPLFTAVSNGAGERYSFVNKTDINGNVIYVNAQDEFIRQTKRICELYLQRGFPIADVEIDFEKARSVDGEAELFAQLLVRVKNEICTPLGLGLRINLLAMTGDFTPNYYAWHDYRTIARKGVVDEYQLMTYDFSWGGSAPGPSTPLWWLEQVLEHVKSIADEGLWNSDQVFIGNAGYGRRWALDEARMGATLDYKQLMQLQNGEYVHNDGTYIYPDPLRPKGATNEYKEFWFRNQDFIPFAGFNDEESDYQITYPHVYDRFTLDSNGGSNEVEVMDTTGSMVSSVNRPSGKNYVTNYSRRQYAKFTGVSDINIVPVKTGRFESRPPMLLHNVTGIAPVTTTPYITLPTVMVPNPANPTGPKIPSTNPDEIEGTLEYTLSGNGTYKLIAMVVMPFFDTATVELTVNGIVTTLSGLNEEWYPFIQKAHFAEVGTYTVNGTLTVEIGLTNGVQVGGFILAETFDHGLSGGTVDFPVSTYPFKRRGNIDTDGTVELVDAQFPQVMRLVGEVLRRPPRPAIIWEDVFGSYIKATVPTYDLVNTGVYYKPTPTGYSQGSWHVVDDITDFAHAYVDARTVSSQLVLNKPFAGNIMIDVEMRPNAEDVNAKYGLRILAQAEFGSGNGYVLLLDHEKGEVRLTWEDPETGAPSTEVIVPMSDGLKANLGTRYSVRAYYLNGKLSCWVNDKCYIDRYTPVHKPLGGAYGVYANKTRLKVYKYHIASLDRFERMERIQVEVNGVTTTYGDIPRNVPLDKYGFLQFTGYPADIKEAVKNPSDADGDGIADPVTATNTIIDTEITKEAWNLDYKNKAIADIPSWVGVKNVRITMLDAGIWFRRFYVGDAEGMSIAYNSDKIGFIRTANLVRKYKCRGIAMWTLGQEDPTIYTYLADT